MLTRGKAIAALRTRAAATISECQALRPAIVEPPRLIALGLYVVPVIVAAAVLVVGHLWQLALALLAVEGTVAGLTALATRRSVAADARPGSGPDSGRRATGPGGGRGATAGPRPPWLVIGAMFGVVALLALLATLASRLG